ncbi:hypothetical protein RRG08_014639 [Elysia crispata]|uniref:Uncharacterized protein n=1 Tax=Elysia crispata TaxID=231223 RepID=A0AAE1CYU8_9GAST|nr:hypothetical protein RRG08_014639 [Elysia crispata]
MDFYRLQTVELIQLSCCRQWQNKPLHPLAVMVRWTVIQVGAYFLWSSELMKMGGGRWEKSVRKYLGTVGAADQVNMSAQCQVSVRDMSGNMSARCRE